MGIFWRYLVTAFFLMFPIQVTISTNMVSADTIYCPNSPSRDGFLMCNGTNRADNIFGTPNRDLIYGFGGNDKILGKTGFDHIYGGEGNDTIIVVNAGIIDCGHGYDVATIYNRIDSGSVDDDCDTITVGD